jgi:BirA family biotin operon repressor/biotin-[acetyl-CoA-carboxylase] ligase
VNGGYDLVRLDASCKRRKAERRIEVRDEVDSTQDLAFALAEHGAPDGTVVAAGRQAKARGRLGRPWSSVAGLGVEFSMVLRPPAEPAPVPNLLVAATAVAVAEAVEASAGLVPGIRWPNDLVLGDRKLAGILVETRDFEPKAPLFVLGIGLNAAHAEGDFPEEVRAEATSVALATGRVPDRTDLLAALLEAVDRWLRTLDEGGAAVVEEAYRARVAYLGRTVRVLDGATPVEGVLESASPVAGLFLRLPEKKWRAIRPEHARDLRPL